MKKRTTILNDESGSIVLIAVIFLFAATVLGVAVTNTSTLEIQISGNHKMRKMVFYAADSGIHYVAVNPSLYGPDNLDTSNPMSFPDPANPATTYPLTSKLNVGGAVTYDKKGQMPPGSGYSAGTVLAIKYHLQSTSTGSNSATDTVRAWFYRIGL